MKNSTVVLKKRPIGKPVVTDFEYITSDVPIIGEYEILLKSSYISVDPYLRGKMSGSKLPRFELDEPIVSKIIAEVIASNHPDYTEGNFVTGYLKWQGYQISNGIDITKIDVNIINMSTYLGVFGVTGLSAYFGLVDIGKPKAGETLVVSGAAGAVGSIAGQIGKIMGCRVIGIVGSQEKVQLIKDKFGFDGAINYKTTTDLRKAIAEMCPDGVDIYFDNVGGEISDAVIANLNAHGRIPVCGTISNYNDSIEVLSPNLLPQIVYKLLTIQGFLISDYSSRFLEGIKKLEKWYTEGKLTYSETIVEGFDNLPQAFIGLFEGRNEGKMIVKI